LYSYYSRPRRRDNAALFFRKGQVVKEVILTPEGYKKLQAEIEYLSNDKRRDVTAKQTVEYYIVGSAEANPAQNKLSNESPVGKAIIGHKKGETVEVTAPRGSMKYKILEIKAA